MYRESFPWHAQSLFSRTGGLHATGLFDVDGKLIALREDVGRHNAVDKLIGWALLETRLPLKESILLVSSRGSFEIIQKALVAGLPIVACVSVASSLAVQLAWEFNLTLVGFLRDKRFVIYIGGGTGAARKIVNTHASPYHANKDSRPLLFPPTIDARRPMVGLHPLVRVLYVP